MPEQPNLLSRQANAVLLLCAVGSVTPFARAEPVYRLPEAELLSSDFNTEPWGSGSLTSREDLPGAGVRFTVRLGSATDNGKTVIGDEWPVAATAGLAWDGGYLPNDPGSPHAQPHSNVDISGWARVAMRVTYLARAGEIRMRLFMNTGMTGPSGYPPNDARNNTAWLSPLVTVKAREPTLLVLDFNNAMAAGATDNPWPHSGYGEAWSNGTWHAINGRDRREITNIGFEIYGPANAVAGLDIDLPDAPTEFTLVSATKPGEVTLGLKADDARDYRIESSTNLLEWTEFRVIPCVTGTVEVTDSALANTKRRYYRAVAEE